MTQSNHYARSNQSYLSHVNRILNKRCRGCRLLDRCESVYCLQLLRRRPSMPQFIIQKPIPSLISLFTKLGAKTFVTSLTSNDRRLSHKIDAFLTWMRINQHDHTPARPSARISATDPPTEQEHVSALLYSTLSAGSNAFSSHRRGVRESSHYLDTILRKLAQRDQPGYLTRNEHLDI